MRNRLPKRYRAGLTLVELMIALIGSSVLLVGLSSSIFVALKASDPAVTDAARIAEATAVLNEIKNDLRYCSSCSSLTSSSISFVTPDRDQNGADEWLFYTWSRKKGDPVYRTCFGKLPVAVLNDVDNLSFELVRQNGRVTAVLISLELDSVSNGHFSTSVEVLNRP